MQVVVDGLLTHYSRTGSGPVVLIIPGWADTSASWQPIQKKLADTSDCIVVDLPGFGGSQAPMQAWGLDDFVSFVASFLAKIGISEPYAIIGHSNGGSIAIRGIGRSQLSANRLLLLASAGIRSGDNNKRLILRMVTKIGKTSTRVLPKKTRSTIRAKLYKSVGSDMLVAEHMQDTFKQIIQEDVQADARQIKTKTLLVYGDRDTDTPLQFGTIYNAAIAKSRLVTVPGAGHFLHTEHPEEITQYIREFLA